MARTNIKSLGIKNLDRRILSDTALQGTLERCHNTRYSDGTLQNVCEFAEYDNISDTNGFKVVYIHQERYVALDADNNLYHVESFFGKLSSVTLLAENVEEGYTIHSYGKILYLTQESGQQQFLYSDDTYAPFSLEVLTPLDNVEVSYAKEQASETDTGECIMLGYNSYIETYNGYLLSREELRSSGYIVGLYFVIFAYRLYDGSITKPSKTYMMTTDGFGYHDSCCVKLYEDITLDDGITYDYAYSHFMYGHKPTFTIPVSDDIVNNEFVKSVVIFATRPELEYDFENCHDIFQDATKILLDGRYYVDLKYLKFTDNDELPTTPFYEIEELLTSDVADGNLTVELNWDDHFDMIEHSPLYDAAFSVHETVHKEIFEFNNRVHSFNQDITLYENVGDYFSDDTHVPDSLVALPDGVSLYFETMLRIDDSLVAVQSKEIEHCYQNISATSADSSLKLYMPAFVSYQDSRAETTTLYMAKDGFRKAQKLFNLTANYSANFSYQMIDTSYSHSTYTVILDDPDTFVPDSIDNRETVTINSRNKVMVSLANNPFVYEPENTYDVDSYDCVIYNVTSAAAALTQDSFGSHPLLLFTSRGLFAMEQGSGNVLYSRVVLIEASDRYQSNKSIALSSIVFFISGYEVMAVVSTTVKSVSSLITPPASSQTELSEYKDYMAGAYIYALIWYNEIMVYNENYSYAYVYSIGSNCWSTRDISARRISNEVLEKDGSLISLYSKEKSTQPLALSIKSNLISLSTNSLKKIEYVEPLYSAPSTLYITTNIYGSNNLSDWYNVGSSTLGLKVGRCGASWRFYKIELMVGGTLSQTDYISLWGFDIKYTTRYMGVVE